MQSYRVEPSKLISKWNILDKAFQFVENVEHRIFTSREQQVVHCVCLHKRGSNQGDQVVHYSLFKPWEVATIPANHLKLKLFVNLILQYLIQRSWKNIGEYREAYVIALDEYSTVNFVNGMTSVSLCLYLIYLLIYILNG